MDKFRVYFNNYNKGKDLVFLFSKTSGWVSKPLVYKNDYRGNKNFVDIPLNLREEFISFLKSHANTYENSKYVIKISFGYKSEENIFISWARKKR